MYTFQFVEIGSFAILGKDIEDVTKDIEMNGHPKFSCWI